MARAVEMMASNFMGVGVLEVFNQIMLQYIDRLATQAGLLKSKNTHRLTTIENL